METFCFACSFLFFSWVLSIGSSRKEYFAFCASFQSILMRFFTFHRIIDTYTIHLHTSNAHFIGRRSAETPIVGTILDREQSRASIERFIPLTFVEPVFNMNSANVRESGSKNAKRKWLQRNWYDEKYLCYVKKKTHTLHTIHTHTIILHEKTRSKIQGSLNGESSRARTLATRWCHLQICWTLHFVGMHQIYVE